MNFKLFKNKELTIQVDEVYLLEGETYYIELEDIPRNLREHYIAEYRLSDFISYHPNNPIATINFVNVVGIVNIFGIYYDVRSTKLYDGESGNQQFKNLLNEIVDISSRLSFSATGVSSAKRLLNRAIPNPTDLERLDYFFQLAFRFPKNKNLDSLINQVIKQPHFGTISKIEKQSISKTHRVHSSYFKELGKDLFYEGLSLNHILRNTSLAKRIFFNSGKTLFPTQVPYIKYYNTNDTVENRFLKYILEDIQSICLRITQCLKDRILLKNSLLLKSKVESYLMNPFFKQIGRLSYIPVSSSVLLTKAGYRELYYHYIQSKFGFKSIVESLTNEALSVGLKSIDRLYEMWVYFKIAQILFENQVITEEFVGRDIKYGDMVYSLIWSGEKIKLFFNYSFTRSSGESYSLTLRPDISLVLNNGHQYLFDAKYKFSLRKDADEPDELARVIKREDIHKMHAYLDAIKNSRFSIAIYPGDNFIFYEKRSKKVKKDADGLDMEGVGAIPLVPSRDPLELNSVLSQIVEKTIIRNITFEEPKTLNKFNVVDGGINDNFI